MGHARYDELRDLEDIFAAIRAMPGISEPTPGTFYFRRKPFLHFHTKDSARWADAKVGASWGAEIPIPLHCAQREKALFLREIRARYEAASSSPTSRCGRRSRASLAGAGKGLVTGDVFGLFAHNATRLYAAPLE